MPFPPPTARGGRRLLLALLGVLTLAGATACSGSGSDAAPSTTAKATTTVSSTTVVPKIDVDTWAKGFCTDFGTWIRAIRTAGDGVGTGVTKGDMEGAKGTIVKLFATSAEDTATLITSLEQGGVPDLTDGSSLVKDLKAKFAAYQKAILAAQAEAKALPTDDPAGFASRVDGLVETFRTETTKVGDSFAEIDTKYPSRELQDALSAGCGS